MYNNTQAFKGAVELRYSMLIAFYRSSKTKSPKGDRQAVRATVQ
jgi:hypothetical protein